MTVLWVVLAGAAGALARFWVDGAIRTRRARTFPLATAVINVSGSLLLGVVTGLVLYDGAAGGWRLIAGTGFCGGYTTFSTASYETVRLAQEARYGAAAGYALGSLVLSLGAAGLGLAVVWAS